MPTIFISYRRADSNLFAGRIHDHLVTAFGDPNVFKDVNDIPPGVDFKTVIEREVGRCDVLLAIIGSSWATITGKDGRRRLDDLDDLVRYEIETAMRRTNVRVIPVLIDGTPVPKAEDLPKSLRPLLNYNAAFVRNDPDFNGDMARLIKALQEHSRGDKSYSAPTVAASHRHRTVESRHSQNAAPTVPSASKSSFLRMVLVVLLVVVLASFAGIGLLTASQSPAAITSTTVAIYATTRTGSTLRSGPGIAYRSVGFTQASEQVEVLGQTYAGQYPWYLIKRNNGSQAWIYSESATLTQTSISIPMMTPPAN
jgi:hypothetical protein